MAWSFLSLPVKVCLSTVPTDIVAMLIELAGCEDRSETDGPRHKHFETVQYDEIILQHCE